MNIFMYTENNYILHYTDYMFQRNDVLSIIITDSIALAKSANYQRMSLCGSNRKS